jgi:hypothetical protein
MDPKFNLTGLKNIYNDYLKRNIKTLVFEIKNGKGLFNFLMFFSDEDIESKDKLYLYLRRINTLIDFKLYGSHKNGDFWIFIKDWHKKLMIEELDLTRNDGSFDFDNFLTELNNTIPNEISKINLIKKEVWTQINKKIPNLFDEPEKTILLGIRKLPPNNRPQEKTLRKLYGFVNGDADTKTNLICTLQSNRTTLAWTNDESKKKKSIVEIFSQLNTVTV